MRADDRGSADIIYRTVYDVYRNFTGPKVGHAKNINTKS